MGLGPGTSHGSAWQRSGASVGAFSGRGLRAQPGELRGVPSALLWMKDSPVPSCVPTPPPQVQWLQAHSSSMSLDRWTEAPQPGEPRREDQGGKSWEAASPH